jgi:hypothetical protein
MKALYPHNPDRTIWLTLYKEEYDGITSNNTLDIVRGEEYKRLCKLHGIKAILLMWNFTIKQTNGLPTCAKAELLS